MKYLLKSARCTLIPRILCPSVESTLISAALNPGIRNPIALNSSMQQILFHHCSSGSCGADCQALCLNMHYSPNLHLLFSVVILTHGRMPITTWRIRTVSFDVMSSRSSGSSSRKTATSERFPFQRTFPVALCLRSWSKRGRLCYFSTLTVIFCFPLMAFSRFPFDADIFPFLSLNRHSCFNSFFPNLKNSCPDLLIYMSLPWSSTSDNSASCCLIC